jgi:hypothetical protein
MIFAGEKTSSAGRFSRHHTALLGPPAGREIDLRDRSVEFRGVSSCQSIEAPSAPSTGTGAVENDGCLVPSLIDLAIRRACRCLTRSQRNRTDLECGESIRKEQQSEEGHERRIEHGFKSLGTRQSPIHVSKELSVQHECTRLRNTHSNAKFRSSCRVLTASPGWDVVCRWNSAGKNEGIFHRHRQQASIISSRKVRMELSCQGVRFV